MALIKCSNCKHEVTDKAKKCIHCRNVLHKETTKKKGKSSNNLIKILGLVLGLIIIGVSGFVAYNMFINNTSQAEKVDPVSYDLKTIISSDDFLKVKESSEVAIVIITRNGCYHCEEFMPILQEVTKEQKIESYILSSEVSFFNNLDLGIEIEATPTTLIYKDNKLLTSVLGYQEKDDFLDFLKMHRIIK